MIRKQLPKEPAYYTPEEIAKPSAKSIYTQMNNSGIDWDDLAKPLRRAFNTLIGRPTDPAVHLKIYLVGYIENITYDTDLAERIADSIAIRNFLGYSLLQKTPDHSTISRIRYLIAENCNIDDILTNTVLACIKHGLVDGEQTAIDTSLMPANASLSSLESIATGKKVREHLKEQNKAAESAADGSKKKKLKVSNDEFRSRTDPDARIAARQDHSRDMCYKAVHLTDSKNSIILAAGASRADEGEAEAAMPVIAKTNGNLEQCGKHPGMVIGDTGFDSADFHAYIESLGIVPLTYYRPDTHKKPEGFKKESFTYDKENNSYICPEGHILTYNNSSDGRMRYVSEESVCALCPSRDKCLEEGRRRWLSRRYTEESRERNIARCHTEEGREALKSRKHIVEPPFGHMKTYGGMSLINCRGLKKVNVKIIMAAVAHNILKLVRAISRVNNLSEATSGIILSAIFGLKAILKALDLQYQARSLSMQVN